MPDKTGNKVHLMYLNYLTNLRRTKRYSWGSACLAVLYREMCRAIDAHARTMSGCASLLQSWAWFRMPFIAPISRVPPTFPLVCQWSGGRVMNYRNVSHNDLVGYRARIDHMQQNQVTFTISISINGSKWMTNIFNYYCSLFGFLIRVWALLLMLKHIGTKQYGRHAQL